MLGKLYGVLTHAWRRTLAKPFFHYFPFSPSPFVAFQKKFGKGTFIKDSPTSLSSHTTPQSQPIMADQLEQVNEVPPTPAGSTTTEGRAENNEEELNMGINMGYVLGKLMQASRNENSKQVRKWETFIQSYEEGLVSVGGRYVNKAHPCASNHTFFIITHQTHHIQIHIKESHVQITSKCVLAEKEKSKEREKGRGEKERGNNLQSTTDCQSVVHQLG